MSTSTLEPLKIRPVWFKIIYFLYLHYGTIVGFYYLFAIAQWKTILWTYLLLLSATHGIAVGAHRLWAHRAFKAKLPLRVLLAFDQTMTFQNDIYDWVRDHRIHHKYSDTEYDPHNASRGFFYSHIGWLMVKKSDKVISKGKELDLSDLERDPVVWYQRKYYWYMAPFLAFVFPALVPWYFWSEPFKVSWYICSIFRVCIVLHGTCLVNSAAHIWGTKPYDKNIKPVETGWVAHISHGEGFHNYHHTFPWDHKAAELGSYYGNWNTAFIDFMAKIGWAYDLKSVPLDMVKKRGERTGDGTKVWGWEDNDMNKENICMAKSQ